MESKQINKLCTTNSNNINKFPVTRCVRALSNLPFSKIMWKLMYLNLLTRKHACVGEYFHLTTNFPFAILLSVQPVQRHSARHCRAIDQRKLWYQHLLSLQQHFPFRSDFRLRLLPLHSCNFRTGLTLLTNGHLVILLEMLLTTGKCARTWKYPHCTCKIYYYPAGIATKSNFGFMERGIIKYQHQHHQSSNFLKIIVARKLNHLIVKMMIIIRNVII